MVGLKAIAIAAVSWGPGRIDIFRAGFNSDLQHASYNGAGPFSAWESLGGIITTVPKVTSWAANRLDVVATGTNYGAYHKSASISFIVLYPLLRTLQWDGSAWSGWEPQGGIFTSTLDITHWSENRLDFFGRGTDVRSRFFCSRPWGYLLFFSCASLPLLVIAS